MYNYHQIFKRVIISGANGFIGSNLARRLVSENVETHIIVRENSDLSLLSDVLGSITVHPHDGTMASMEAIFKVVRPELVYHVAAYSPGEHSTTESEETITSNIVFGSQLLEAMLSVRSCRIVNTGTFWQHYGNRVYSPVNLYAAAKQAFQSLLQYYAECFSFQCITLQLFESYGRADPRPKLLSLLKQSIHTGKTLGMTPGKQPICLVHISDIVEAYMLAGKYLFEDQRSNPATYFVRPPRSIQLQELVSLLSDIVGKSIEINWGEKAYRKREILDEIDILPVLPGWTPKMELKNGLQEYMNLP